MLHRAGKTSREYGGIAACHAGDFALFHIYYRAVAR
jgi:hypothetical protein